MQISEILSSDRIRSDIVCESKKNALAIAAKLIANADSSLSQNSVFDCFLARERLGTTGLGNGIAIPHGRLQYNQATLASFIKIRNGVDYDSVDGKPVDLLFALIVPEDATDEHLQILSKLAEKFDDRNLVHKMRSGISPEAIHKILTEE